MATTKNQTTLPKIVTVTVIGRLGSVRGMNGPIRPDMFSVKTKDPQEEGTPVGEFPQAVFMNTSKVIGPFWDNILQEWQFDGDYATFTRLVKAMNLRYPDGHPSGRGRIKVESLDSHKKNRQDPVFQNAELQGKFVIQNGRGTLRVQDDPKHEFFYYCFRNCRKFVDETVEGEVQEHPGAKFRMTATKRKNLTQRAGVDKRMEAMSLLATMANNEEKLRAICALAKVPSYSHLTDVNGMVVLLDHEITHNPDRKVGPQGGRQFISVLLDYMKMADDQLMYEADIMKAYSLGILRHAQGGVNLQGILLAGPGTFAQTVKYFRDPKNQDDYFTLTTALGKR